MEVSASARKGDSGGPILNQKGELAGVLFGSDMIRNTAGSYSERVNRFLVATKSKMEGLPSRPETYFAMKEKNGPVHSLQDSRNAAPQSPVAPQTSAVIGSSSSSFGVRSTSGSQRYVPPVTNGQPRIPQQTPLPRQETSTPSKPPLTSLTPVQTSPAPRIEQASWAETSPKFGKSIQPTKLAQTAYLKPLEPVSTTMPMSEYRLKDPDRYQLKVSADRNDQSFAYFMALNVCLAVGLSCFAVRLLRT
jgi:hypothetical protein